MLSCSQLFDMCTGRAWDQLVTTSWARPHKSCGIPDSPGDPYGKPMKLRHASGHPICTLGYQKIVLWRPRPPKRSQNGTQNGAKSTTADPHETCTGIVGLHIQPPLGSSIFAPFQSPTKISPKIRPQRHILQNMCQNYPPRGPSGTSNGARNGTKIALKSENLRPLTPK